LAKIYGEGLWYSRDLEKAQDYYQKAACFLQKYATERNYAFQSEKNQQKIKSYVQAFLNEFQIHEDFFHQSCYLVIFSEKERSSEGYFSEGKAFLYMKKLQEEISHFRELSKKQDKEGELISLWEIHRIYHALIQHQIALVHHKYPKVHLEAFDSYEIHDAYLLLEAIQNMEIGTEIIAPHYKNIVNMVAHVGHLKAKQEQNKLKSTMSFIHKGFDMRPGLSWGKRG
jgi:hypothetical protein